MDNQMVRRVGKEGKITTVAGTGKRGYAGDGGPATRAELNEPYELRFAANGDLFFVEMKNNLVRQVNKQTGIITTVAGTGREGFAGDGGPATGANFRQPHSIQFDQAGNLYVCDIGNHRVRRVDAGTKVIKTFAGTGERVATVDGAKIDGAALNGPRALDFDRDGNLWLALREGNAIYQLDPRAGTIHHQAGTGQKGFAGHGGPAKIATLSGPKGISVGPDGNIYFADTESHSIRMLNTRQGTMELVAGTGERGDGPDGDGRACRFSRPHGIFVERDGTILVGDSENHKVRVIRRAR
jgi:streptogramin lyase